MSSDSERATTQRRDKIRSSQIPRERVRSNPSLGSSSARGGRPCAVLVQISMRLYAFALLAVAHTAGSYLAAAPRACTAARRSWPLALLADDAVLACEQEVTRAFAAVNSAPADADKAGLLRQLKDAQDAVAVMRADRERERCARA